MHLSVPNASDSTGSLARHNRVSRLECTSGGLVESRKIRALAGHAVPTDDERVKATVQRKSGPVAMPAALRQACTAATGQLIEPQDDGNGRALSLRATSSDRRNAPAKPSSSARSRSAFRPLPVPSAIEITRSAVAGAFSRVAVPSARRIPRTVAFTRSSSVGTAWPASARILRHSTRPPLVHSKRETLLCPAREPVESEAFGTDKCIQSL